MRLGVRTVSVALGVLVGGACARRPVAPSADAATTQSATRTVEVMVENHNFNDVVITVKAGSGQSQRIGTVTGNARKSLTFPASFAAASQPLQLVSRLVGGRSDLVSEGFTVQPGQRVVLTLENGFTRSTIEIY